MKSKCMCGNEKEAWQTTCKRCYAKQKEKENGDSNKGNGSRDADIRLQVCLKAMAAAPGKTPEQIAEQAKELYGLMWG